MDQFIPDHIKRAGDNGTKWNQTYGEAGHEAAKLTEELGAQVATEVVASTIPLVQGAADDLLDLGSPSSAHNQVIPTRIAPNSGLVARIQGKLGLYPKVIDPRTGRHIQFPSGIKGPVDKSLRVAWDSKMDRAAFIAEWHRRGYATPSGGWDKFDIHHIQPREFGGTNDFWNLVPVERNTHQELFNEFWREFTGL